MPSPLELVPLELDEPDAVPVRVQQQQKRHRLALSPVEQLAVSELLADSREQMAVHVAERATALAGADGDAVRRRSLSRMLAISEAQCQQLAAGLATAVASGNERLARLLDRLLTTAQARFLGLADEHRVELVGGRRAVLMIGSAEQVNVTPRCGP